MNRARAHGLGRGLEALIPLPEALDGTLAELISVEEIRPSTQQVRRRFDGEALRELADSSVPRACCSRSWSGVPNPATS